MVSNLSLRTNLVALPSSFIGLIDLKMGGNLISYFGLLNKVAGVYGILAVVHTGDLRQVALYVYSLATLALLAWGIRSINKEHGPHTLLYAHLFALDHVVSTCFTLLFGIAWWGLPHDGKKVANSAAQEAMMHLGGGADTKVDDATRTAAAQGVWRSERAFSGVVLLLGWSIKIYFILVLYSLAIHYRRGTYNQLPLSKPAPPPPSRSSHTRGAPSGGHSYHHLRSHSTATSVPDSEADFDLAFGPGAPPSHGETLWEQDEFLGQSQRLQSTGEVPPSPAYAKGTGMARSASGQQPGMVRSASNQGAGGGGEGPFAKVLGKMSGDWKR